MLAEVRSILG